MFGLSYACFHDEDEKFLWIDADGRDNSTAILWRKDRLRLYAPLEFLSSRNGHEQITDDQFDRFFAVQILEIELENRLESEQHLLYFLQYPHRLRLTIRGEFAIETEHFKQHGISNFGGEPLFGIMRKLRDHVARTVDGSAHTDKAHYKHLILSRIKNLFRDDQFDDTLFQPDGC